MAQLEHTELREGAASQIELAVVEDGRKVLGVKLNDTAEFC